MRACTNRCVTEWSLRDATRAAAGSPPSTWFCNGRVQLKGTTGGYHFFLTPHSIGAWFAIAFAAQIPFLEAATHRAILSQHACSIALSFLLRYAPSMCISFFCSLLLNGACEKPTWSSTPSYAMPLSSTTSASRASPPTTSRAPADRTHHPRLAPSLKLITLNVSHRARHHTGRLESHAERPRRGACRRLHVSRRCTRHTQPCAAEPSPFYGSDPPHARVQPFECVYVACLNLHSYM